MVRRMVAALLAVGTGRIGEADVAAALVGGRPALRGAAAPARGLCLRRVALGRKRSNRNEDARDE
jgi:tRNA U38,U39,U40 pseudouridine synthase TruA